MNPRVHIHKENMKLSGEARHFTITLPPDVIKVIGVKATATPSPDDPKARHWEIGRLRISRDGVFLCDMPVWFEGQEPTISLVGVPGVINNSGKVYLSGKHNWSLQIEIPGDATVLTCLFQGSSLFDEYTLSIYIYYDPKQ